MKTKFKDLLLYSLATIGVVALFISATNKQSVTDVNIVSVGGSTLTTWCNNSDCSQVEIVPTRDFNNKLDRVSSELTSIQSQMSEIIKQIRYLK
jgi:hypothetical protein